METLSLQADAAKCSESAKCLLGRDPRGIFASKTFHAACVGPYMHEVLPEIHEQDEPGPNGFILEGTADF